MHKPCNKNVTFQKVYFSIFNEDFMDSLNGTFKQRES